MLGDLADKVEELQEAARQQAATKRELRAAFSQIASALTSAAPAGGPAPLDTGAAPPETSAGGAAEAGSSAGADPPRTVQSHMCIWRLGGWRAALRQAPTGSGCAECPALLGDLIVEARTPPLHGTRACMRESWQNEHQWGMLHGSKGFFKMSTK